MAREATCPICNANIPLEKDDKRGDHVYCSYCGAQLRVGSDIESRGSEKEVEVEEDWE